MTAPLDLDELERVARAVRSPHDWTATELVVHPSFNAPNQPRVAAGGRDIARMGMGGDGNESVVAATFCTVGKYEIEQRNAAHIATFDPATVLRLIAELREARERLDYHEQLALERSERD